MSKELAILKLIHGKMIDFSLKKQFKAYEWAELIKHYMENKGYKSVREYANKENIKRSTIRGWLMPLRLSEKEYNAQVRSGKTKEQVFKNMPKKYYNLDDLIKYFRDFKPSRNDGAETRNKLGTLIAVLMDCKKK